MKNYSILSNKSWQLIKKYCIELDYNIHALQNHIDFINPNKVILNYTYNDKETNFYSSEDLVNLGICSTHFITLDWNTEVRPDPEHTTVTIDPTISINFTLQDWQIKANRSPQNGEVYYWKINTSVDWFSASDTNIGPIIKCNEEVTFCILRGNVVVYGATTILRVNFIDTSKLYAGQIIYNNFGQDIRINNLSTGPILKQGFGLFKVLTQNPDYLIISLDSEGDYYVVVDVTTEGQVIFSYLSHATASLGMYYLFSLVGPNARWFYVDRVRNVASYSPSNWEGFTLVSWTWPETSQDRIPLILSHYRTLWTASSTISNEIYRKNNNQYEEVIISEEIITDTRGLDKGSLSLYSMNTDINSSVANALNLAVYLY